jgi:hydrogenase 3 maturation protease
MIDEEELRKWFSNIERVVIIGIGNPIRGDDSVGLKIAQDLQGKIPRNVYLIECETVPESFAQSIVDFDPTRIILIDAAVMDKRAGDSVLVDPESLPVFPAISTHALPLRIFCDFITKNTRAKIVLLLIEPDQTSFGENLSPIVDDSAKKIVNLFIKIFTSSDQS